MKEIELFHLDSCPYCINARRAIEELTEENPAFAGISVRWIEESEEPELADSRDYQYVPCIFYGEKKLYEAHFTHSYAVIKDSIRAAFETVLGA